MYQNFNPYVAHVNPCLSRAELELRNTMRLLWSQHVYWTRAAVIALINDSPDLDMVLARLLRNAPEMGEALVPFYGKEAGDRYGELIKEHLVIAADLVKAAKAGDTKKFEAIDKKWYANADDISEFLSMINPFISKQDMQEMMYKHLELLKTETTYLIQKNHTASINTFDLVELQALHMADEISEAIVSQFSCTPYY